MLRAGIRLLGFIVCWVLVVFLFWIGLPVCWLKQGWRIEWKNRLITAWAKVITKLIGMRIEVDGQAPEPPFLLVSNHLGYLDVLLYWSYLKTTFVAKSEIRDWPFIGLTARLLGILFLNRTRHRDLSRVNLLIEQNISNHQGVIVFPEGTSSKGEKVLPFKSSLLNYPALVEMPVYYASISYQTPDREPHEAYREICWWGDMDFVSHFFNLLKIRSFTAIVRFGDKAMVNSNRKVLAGDLHEAVQNDFVATFDG